MPNATHAILILIGTFIGAATLFAGLFLNARYNTAEPYFMRGFVVARIVGLCIGLVMCFEVFILSRFW